MALLAQNDSDQTELIRKAIAGNEVAFGQIYDLYFEKLYRFVFYRVNHREIAEDLVAEIFIRVWHKISEIKDSAAFRGWVFQIARNIVIDHYRTKKIHVDLSTLENVLEYEDNLIDRTDLSFQQKEFIEALRKLTDEQQVVIKLKFFDDLDNHEISKILNKSEGAIRVIQHRAIHELKHLIENHDQ